MTAVVDENGSEFKVAVVDITDQKSAEESLEKLKNDLEKIVNKKTADLKDKIEVLQRLFDATVEREFRMKELYEENLELKGKMKELLDRGK